MSRAEALAAVRRLTLGLEPDLAGTHRLLERIASHPDAEILRDALLDLGARSILDIQENKSAA